jgi:8-amino-7-oxononanoate synthase
LAEINVLFTESLFSMDGDRADLSHMMELATKYRGVLVVDEAHAIGCYGEQGRGLTSGLNHKCIISINTCGKALGVQGALVCGPQWFTEYLINKARPFIYSTAPSPWLAAALMVSLKYVARMDQERDRLQALSDQVRGELKRLGFDTGISQSHIIPVLCGSDRKALELGAALSEDQVIVKAIRPPTVPEGSSRLRLSLRADLTDAHVETLISAFRRLR